MRRVLVIGPGGAGRTTVARRLALATGLPLVHLDALHWRPGGVAPAADDWARTVAALVAGEAWILDGNHGGTLDVRLAACDRAVLLDPARGTCLWRALWRSLTQLGRTREEIAPGCPEGVDLAFPWWIWTYPARRRATRGDRLPHGQVRPAARELDPDPVEPREKFGIVTFAGEGSEVYERNSSQRESPSSLTQQGPAKPEDFRDSP